jgi:adenosine deaminase
MTIESFFKAVPKADLGLQLEGAVPLTTLQMFANQNDLAGTKAYNETMKQFNTLNYSKLPELASALSQWIRHTDDLSRMVYDVGVHLSKQNVRYAEIGVDPLMYITPLGLSFEQFAAALDDGRTRAQRAWNIQMMWVFNIPREEYRRTDDVLRFGMSATGRKYGVVAVGLSGREDSQPVSQFERAFKAAERKEFPTVVHAGDSLGSEGLKDALMQLSPSRIIGGWGLVRDEETTRFIIEQDVVITVPISRHLLFGRLEEAGALPLDIAVEQGVRLSVTAHMPTFYNLSLSDELVLLVERYNLPVSEVEKIALNGLRYSLLPEENRNQMLNEFRAQYDELRTEHIEQQEV